MHEGPNFFPLVRALVSSSDVIYFSVFGDTGASQI